MRLLLTTDYCMLQINQQNILQIVTKSYNIFTVHYTCNTDYCKCVVRPFTASSSNRNRHASNRNRHITLDNLLITVVTSVDQYFLHWPMICVT